MAGAETVHEGWDLLALQRLPFQLFAEGRWDCLENGDFWKKSEHFQMQTKG